MMFIKVWTVFLTVCFRDDGAAMSMYDWYTQYKDQAVYIVQQQHNMLGDPMGLYVNIIKMVKLKSKVQSTKLKRKFSHHNLVLK